MRHTLALFFQARESGPQAMVGSTHPLTGRVAFGGQPLSNRPSLVIRKTPVSRPYERDRKHGNAPLRNFMQSAAIPLPKCRMIRHNSRRAAIAFPWERQRNRFARCNLILVKRLCASPNQIEPHTHYRQRLHAAPAERKSKFRFCARCEKDRNRGGRLVARACHQIPPGLPSAIASFITNPTNWARTIW